MPDIMLDLVKTVVNARYERLGAEAIDYAKKSVLDTIGAVIAGSTAEGCREVVELVKEWGGKEESTIWVFGGKVPAVMAGLAIGPMARARDLGDVYSGAGHISEYVIPAAFPIAERQGGINGRDFITAIAAGQDIGIRLGISEPRDGASPLGKISIIFGATAAVGKLLGLDEETMLNAMGIAFSQVGGDKQAYPDGALTVRVRHGFVADGAIKSVLLAQKGITGARNILQGKYGFYKAFAPEHNLAALTSGLGETFRGGRTGMKLYPCCRFTHGAIDATIDLVKEHGIRPQDVAEIDVAIGDWGYSYVAEPLEAKRNPQNVVDCQFSLPYTVATALVKGSVFIEDFTEEGIKREDIREHLHKVAPRVDKALVTPDNLSGGTALTIKTKQGREYSKTVLYPRGHSKNPLTMDGVVEKFRRCLPFSARPFPEKNVDRIIEMVINLESVPDVAEIARLLAPGVK
ncbi:MAG: MmgE/PrpD family protein [Chloroflexi bacterium]|nr:MmgE/PrpD family protein [Chloroflexota bacterium]